MGLILVDRRPGDVLARGEMAGYQWIVMHNNMGYRCGYIRIPIDHPWAEIDRDNLDGVVKVHGGVTFTDDDTEERAFWIGFDCGHSNDAIDPELPSKGMPMMILGASSGTVRTQEYVERECARVCLQANEAESELDSIDANEMVKDIARRERKTIRGQALAEFRTILQNKERVTKTQMSSQKMRRYYDRRQDYLDGVTSCREALDMFIKGEKNANA